jgi:hypothetical protein
MTATEKKHGSGIGYMDLKLLVWLWLLSATRLLFIMQQVAEVSNVSAL